MSDNIMLMIGDDGEATLYDDTYDITIHCESKEEHDEAMRLLKNVPPERKEEKWTTEEVAELLFNMFGDECACNFNGIDEWLPESCKYAETTCPEPTEKHGCWMQFLLQGGADMRGEQE